MNNSPDVLALDVDQATLNVTNWPVNNPRAVVQIVHGMVEHGRRYAPFAEYLNSQGIAVVTHDHRGHGATESADGRGAFSLHDGWETAVNDLDAVRVWVDSQYPGLPHFLFGHSMGSLLTRDYIAQHGRGLSGVIVMGTAVWPGVKGDIGMRLAELLAKLRPTATGTLLNKATFAGYNERFEKRTEFDWLSRDPKQVDAYIADPDCGFVPTTSFFRDLLVGTKRANSDAAYSGVPANLPILVVSGSVDPVGGAGAVAEVASKFRANGVSDVSFVSFPDARHELLNETNRDEVFAKLGSWIEQRANSAKL